MKSGPRKRRNATSRERRGANAARTKMPAREPVLVEIGNPVYGGKFLARVEGKAVFVPLALPGERASVRIVDDRRSYASAELVEITQRAKERVTPACKHFGACGGCDYQHTSYANQIEFKKAILRETLKRGGVAEPAALQVLAAEPWAYRNRIRLALDATGNAGYRGRGSHVIVPMEECPIAAPLLVRAARTIEGLARRESNALAVDEISLFCNADETQLLGTLTVRHGSVERAEEVARLWTDAIPELAGVQFIRTQGAGRPPLKLAQWGAKAIEYVAAGSSYRVEQNAFFQVNRWLIDRLVETVTDGLSGQGAWDLYAGVGLFARKLAHTFSHVTAVESAPESTLALRYNLQGSSGKAVIAQTLAFLRDHLHDRPDAIVVDPPRTGLGAEVTELLGKVGAPQVVYVSCDPATLARDLRVLIGAGYAMQSVTLADLFPQTYHLETVVHLRRK